MPDPKEVKSVFDQVDNVINVASDTVDMAKRPEERDLLKAVVAKLKEARKDAEAIVGPGLQAMKDLSENQVAKAEKLQAEIHQHLAQVEAMEAELKQKAAQVPQPPEPPAELQIPKIDHELGSVLQNELLEKFGIELPPEEPPIYGGKDIWEEWK